MEEYKHCLCLKMSQVKDKLVMDDEMANIYKMKVDKENLMISTKGDLEVKTRFYLYTLYLHTWRNVNLLENGSPGRQQSVLI